MGLSDIFLFNRIFDRLQRDHRAWHILRHNCRVQTLKNAVIGAGAIQQDPPRRGLSQQRVYLSVKPQFDPTGSQLFLQFCRDFFRINTQQRILLSQQ